MWVAWMQKIFCRLKLHAWVEHQRGFHQVCSRCGKMKWVVGPPD